MAEFVPAVLTAYFCANDVQLFKCVHGWVGNTAGRGLATKYESASASFGNQLAFKPLSQAVLADLGLLRCFLQRILIELPQGLVDVTESGHSVAGKRAFAMAGIGPRDVASFHPYDDFIIAIMLQFEMLGFCKHGQGCDFIQDTDFAHTGNLPLNTGGGQISAGQCGLAGGGTNLIEAVRQLFGEGGKRQVSNTKNAVVTGIGGIPYGRNWATSVVMVLTPDA